MTVSTDMCTKQAKGKMIIVQQLLNNCVSIF